MFLFTFRAQGELSINENPHQSVSYLGHCQVGLLK